MRSSLVDELGQDYLTTARAKGMMDELVRRRHAVPNALLPTITLVFLNIGFVVSGAITVETVFSWPGLGLLSYQALRGPDVPLAAGDLPDVLHRRRRRQRGRRRRGRGRRPAGPDMSVPEPVRAAVPLSAAGRRARPEASGSLRGSWLTSAVERGGVVGLAHPGGVRRARAAGAGAVLQRRARR